MGRGSGRAWVDISRKKNEYNNNKNGRKKKITDRTPSPFVVAKDSGAICIKVRVWVDGLKKREKHREREQSCGNRPTVYIE